MAAMMDNMKDKAQDMMGGDIRERFEELRQKEKSGTLDDKGREELQEIRAKFQHPSD